MKQGACLRLLRKVVELCKPVDCRGKRILVAREVQAHEVVHILAEEAGTRHGGNAHIADHPFAELQIAVTGKLGQRKELADIHHDEIAALRHRVRKAERIQALHEEIALFGVKRLQALVIVRAKAQAVKSRSSSSSAVTKSCQSVMGKCFSYIRYSREISRPHFLCSRRMAVMAAWRMTILQ